MENQNNSKELLQNAVGVQTDSIKIMFCKECEYPADNIFDLGEHMFEFHTERYENKMDCHYCDDSFNSKDRLMKHQKEMH